jgi:hypothetical protein
MVWLEQTCHLSEVTSKEEVHKLLKTNELSSSMLFDFTTHKS